MHNREFSIIREGSKRFGLGNCLHGSIDPQNILRQRINAESAF